MAYGFKANTNLSITATSGEVINLNPNSFVVAYEDTLLAFEADSPENAKHFAISMDGEYQLREWMKTNAITVYETEEEYKAALAATQAAIETQKEIEKAKEITEQQDKEEDDKEKKKKRNTIIGVVAGIALLAIALSVINKKN